MLQLLLLTYFIINDLYILKIRCHHIYSFLLLIIVFYEGIRRYFTIIINNKMCMKYEWLIHIDSVMSF